MEYEPLLSHQQTIYQSLLRAHVLPKFVATIRLTSESQTGTLPWPSLLFHQHSTVPLLLSAHQYFWPHVLLMPSAIS